MLQCPVKFFRQNQNPTNGSDAKAQKKTEISVKKSVFGHFVRERVRETEKNFKCVQKLWTMSLSTKKDYLN